MINLLIQDLTPILCPETDGPFVSHNGRVLGPGDVIRVVETLGHLWNIDKKAAQCQIIENCKFILKRNGEDISADYFNELLPRL